MEQLQILIKESEITPEMKLKILGYVFHPTKKQEEEGYHFYSGYCAAKIVHADGTIDQCQSKPRTKIGFFKFCLRHSRIINSDLNGTPNRSRQGNVMDRNHMGGRR